MPRAPRATSPVQGPHMCSEPDCGKSFKNKSELKRHETIHLNEKPFVCEFKGCGKNFAQRTQLNNHENTHTGKRPHDCRYCGKNFNDTACKSRHEREQHSTFGGFRCPAPRCAVVMKRKDGFQNHMSKQHGVSKSTVDPWHHAVTKYGGVLDPTKGLHEQLEWDKPLFFSDDVDEEAEADFVRANKGKKVAAPGKGRNAIKQDTEEDEATVPKTRSRKRRRADVEDNDDDDEYKPATRAARPIKRSRKSAVASEPPAVAPAPAAPAEDTFSGLYTISPYGASRNDAWGPGPSGTTTPAVQTTETQLSFNASTYGPAPVLAEPSTHLSQNALGLSLPFDSSDYLGFSSTLPTLSITPSPGLETMDDFSLLLGQGPSFDFNDFDAFALGTSVDGSVGLGHSGSSTPSWTDPYTHINAPTATTFHDDNLYYDTTHHASGGDLLSVSSPLTPSSQGSSRSPSPIGLVPANNDFSVPSISSLGRARQSAQLMPRVRRQDISHFNGYTSLM